jgi:hypothetical protein
VGEYLFAALPELVDIVEGFQDVTQGRQASVAKQLSEHADRVIAAHWGDVWFDRVLSSPPARTTDDALVASVLPKLYKPGHRWLMEHLIRPRLDRVDIDGVLRDAMVAELQRIPRLPDDDFRLKALKTDTWSFRWTLASIRMYQRAIFPRLVFYDTRLTDFFSTVPSEWLSERRLQRELLKRKAPDLARIPWQGFGVNLYWRDHFDTWLLPWRAGRKAIRRLRRTKPPIVRNWEVQFSSPKGRRQLRSALLGDGAPLAGLADPGRIEQLLARLHAQGDRESGYAASILLTLSQTLRAHS